MKKLVRLFFFATILVLFSCNTQKYVEGNYSFETECMGVKMDGSQTLKVWGAGRNKSEAIEQAKINAVRDVLFKGIRNGKTDCNLKPIIIGVRVKENNETYFNSFFADNGLYKDYVTGDDSKSNFKERKKSDDYKTYSIIVNVQRAKLRKKMITDNIIK